MTEKWQVIMKSDLFGSEAFTYDSQEEALEGAGRLLAEGLTQDDGVQRWVCVLRPDQEGEDGDSTQDDKEDWLERWKREGDDMLCPNCGVGQLETQDGITSCYNCGWQAENPVAQANDADGEDEAG